MPNKEPRRVLDLPLWDGPPDTLPCGCSCELTLGDKHGPVFWNHWNKVCQCHKCGQVYTPFAPQKVEADED
jgi:hypothetical protein